MNANICEHILSPTGPITPLLFSLMQLGGVDFLFQVEHNQPLPTVSPPYY